MMMLKKALSTIAGVVLFPIGVILTAIVALWYFVARVTGQWAPGLKILLFILLIMACVLLATGLAAGVDGAPEEADTAAPPSTPATCPPPAVLRCMVVADLASRMQADNSVPPQVQYWLHHIALHLCGETL